MRRRAWTCGLDIGTGFCKAAVIEHGPGAPRLTRVAVAPNESGADSGEERSDPGRVADVLSLTFKQERIEPRDVVIGVGGRDVMSKVIEVERMDEEEARAVIPWEAEQHVPFDMENVELDFTIIDPDGDGPAMTVLLAAAKRTLVEDRISLLRAAGLTPVMVDVEALALHNALEMNYPSAMRDVTALVDIGSGSTTVHLLQDGLPVLTRELAVAAPTHEGLTEGVHRLARGLERAGAFVEGETRLGIACVYLCGGGGGVSGLAEALAERLGVETRVASAFERLEIAPEVADRADIGSLAPMLMLSVGLALRNPAEASFARREG